LRKRSRRIKNEMPDVEAGGQKFGDDGVGKRVDHEGGGKECCRGIEKKAHERDKGTW